MIGLPAKPVRKKRVSLDDRLVGILSKKPQTVPELQDQVNANYWAIRKAIDRMEKKGDVIRIDERRRPEGSGRSEAVYAYVGTVPLTQFMQVIGTSEAEDARANVDAQRGVIHSIVTKSMHDPEFDEEKRRKYFAEAAHKFVREDPRDLLFRFAKWLFARHEVAVEAYKQAVTGKASPQVLEQAESQIEQIENMVRVIFNRNLGIPDIQETAGKTFDGPLRLKFKKRELQVIESFDDERVKSQLEFAVVGRAVLEKYSVPTVPREYSEAGTDASIRKFDLSLFPSAFEKVKMAIVTAAAIRLNFYDPNPPQIDARPEPRQWRYYTEDDAIDQGLLVPPDAYLRLEEIIWERVTSASMNLRQYKKDLDCFEQDKLGRIPDILFRDGRLYPLEHLFDDFCQPGIHGRIVRKGIESFRDIVNKVGRAYPSLSRPVYFGVVKRPEVNILSPLVFWYFKYGSDQPIWPTMDEQKFLLRTPMSDQRVAHYLFAAVIGELQPNERWTTCRFVRKFVAMNEKVARSSARTYQEWLEFLQQEVDKFNFNPDVDPYAELCAHAAVTAFYVSLPLGRAGKSPEDYLTPRYETLIPFQLVETSDHELLTQYDGKLVNAVLTALGDPKGLEVYTESLHGPLDPGRSSHEPVFIYPKATTLAHDYTKAVGDVYQKDFLGYLWKIIIEVVKASKRKASYIS